MGVQSKGDIVGDFPPKHFNEAGEIGQALLSKEQSIVLYKKTEKNKNLYDNFFPNFEEALSKFPQSHIKKIITDIYNKNIIRLGFSLNDTDDPLVCARVSIDQPNDTLLAIILNYKYLGIDIETGKVNNINECIYASYYGLIRAIVLLNSSKIYKDYNLHKLLISYLNLLILKVLGKRLLDSGKQRKLILMAVAYIYFRHFLKQQHLMAISSIKNHFSDTLTKEFIIECMPAFDIIKKYNSIREIGKILIDLKIIREDPSKIILDIFNMFKSAGFHGIATSLDIFIAMACLSKYPTELFVKQCYTLDKVHNGIEKSIMNYFRQVKFYAGNIA